MEREEGVGSHVDRVRQVVTAAEVVGSSFRDLEAKLGVLAKAIVALAEAVPEEPTLPRKRARANSWTPSEDEILIATYVSEGSQATMDALGVAGFQRSRESVMSRAADLREAGLIGKAPTGRKWKTPAPIELPTPEPEPVDQAPEVDTVELVDQNGRSEFVPIPREPVPVDVDGRRARLEAAKARRENGEVKPSHVLGVLAEYWRPMSTLEVAAALTGPGLPADRAHREVKPLLSTLVAAGHARLVKAERAGEPCRYVAVRP